MAVYYIRGSGSDSNTGTSPAAAWRTFGKALGASGIASGDTLYCGSFVYREAVTVAMTSATAETRIIGDVYGEHTGDAGEVVWSAYTAGDNLAPSASSLLTLAGRDFLTFERITFVSGTNTTASIVLATTATSTDITFRRCTFLSGSENGPPVAMTNNTTTWVFNWLFDGCRFLANLTAGTAVVTVNLQTLTTGADYDANVLLKNCLVLTGGDAVRVAAIGTSTFKGGGVRVYNSTSLCAAIIRTSTATHLSTTVPCEIRNCLSGWVYANQASAATAGQIVVSNTRTAGNPAFFNVTADAATRLTSFPALLVSIGQEADRGAPPVPFLSPVRDSPIGTFGADLSYDYATDLLDRPRPSGNYRVADSGTATAGAASTLTDSGKAWGVNQWTGYQCRIVSGTGAGQWAVVLTNTATALTMAGTWTTNPDATSVYEIVVGPWQRTGNVASATSTTLVQTTGQLAGFAGYLVDITAGTNPQTGVLITAATATTLTVASWPGGTPDSTSDFRIYKGAWDAPQQAVGAYERHDIAVRETGTTDAGGVGIMLHGPGDHDFLVPVDAVSTTISVKARYDADHGSTSKPQAILLAQGGIGVATETETMTAAVDTWETLTFSSFTPTAKGVVTVRLVSRADKPRGKCFFDTFA